MWSAPPWMPCANGCSRPGGTLEIDVPADLPVLRADQDALVTALLNLLDNAYKYTPADRRIRWKRIARTAMWFSP